MWFLTSEAQHPLSSIFARCSNSASKRLKRQEWIAHSAAHVMQCFCTVLWSSKLIVIYPRPLQAIWPQNVWNGTSEYQWCGFRGFEVKLLETILTNLFQLYGLHQASSLPIADVALQFWALGGLLLRSHVLGHQRNRDQTSTLKIFELLPYFIVLLHFEQHRYFGAMDGSNMGFDNGAGGQIPYWNRPWPSKEKHLCSSLCSQSVRCCHIVRPWRIKMENGSWRDVCWNA